MSMHARSGRGAYGGQCGATLVECLIAILLFSFGVLAIVALQARSIADVGQAQARVQAACSPTS